MATVSTAVRAIWAPKFQDHKANQTRGSHKIGENDGAGGGRAETEETEGLVMGELKCRSVKGCESTRAPTFKILKILSEICS